MRKRLSRKNAIYTSASGTTVLVNYDAAVKILEVEFIEHDVYHYLHVPEKVWAAYKQLVKEGGSSGTFVNTVIKPHYEFIRL